MIFSLEIVKEIYQDRTNRWKPYVEKLYEQQCDKKPCTVQSAPAIKMPK
jgi:hypothetical protein